MRNREVICMIIILLSQVSKTQAQVGRLDSLFGSNGITISSIDQRSDYLMSTKIGPDGSIYSAGFYTRFGDESRYFGYFVTKYKTDGFLDSSFSTDGIFQDTLTGGAYLGDLIILPDGTVIAAGASYDIPTYPILIKIKPDGRYDSSFGVNGKIAFNTLENISISRIIKLHDDKILASVSYYNGVDDYDLGLIRFASTGALDPSYGTGGINIIHNSHAYQVIEGMAIQEDEKAIVIGRQYSSYPESFGIISRVNANGKLDSSFGTNGSVIVAAPISGGHCALLDVTVRSGRIVATGYSIEDLGGSTYDNHFLIARFLPNGTLDTTFNNDGILISDVYRGSEIARASIVQGDGKIITVGQASEPSPSFQSYVTVVRYMADGTIDSSFNSNGIFIKDLNGVEGQSAVDANFSADGRIIVTGTVYEDNRNGFLNIFAAKLNSGIELIASIKNTSSDQTDLVVYPNPADDHINIDAAVNGKEYTGHLTDITGKVVIDFLSPMNVDTRSLLSGSYILILDSGERRYRMLIQVQH